MKIIKKPVMVDFVLFDGEEIEASVVSDFLNEVFEFEDTIGKEGNYTNEYIYFLTEKERELESILLKYNVIRKPNYFKDWNSWVEEDRNNGGKSKGYYTDYKYWLGDGYVEFRKEFYSMLW
jgi:hypothetical protein